MRRTRASTRPKTFQNSLPPHAACSIASKNITSSIAANCYHCMRRCSMKTLFFDIDTQIDFVYPAGALYVSGAEKIIPVVAQLNQRAPALISTMDAHAEDDPEFKLYPHHCVAGTTGQQKPAATLRAGNQHIIEKQSL